MLLQDVRLGDEFALNGGAELGLMSTTEDVAVAVRYAVSHNSLLLKVLS